MCVCRPLPSWIGNAEVMAICEYFWRAIMMNELINVDMEMIKIILVLFYEVINLFGEIILYVHCSYV